MRTLLRTGDRGLIKFRFVRYKEFLTVGNRLLFREGKTKGIGKIVGVCVEGVVDLIEEREKERDIEDRKEKELKEKDRVEREGKENKAEVVEE
jgi:hypothetical protein